MLPSSLIPQNVLAAFQSAATRRFVTRRLNEMGVANITATEDVDHSILHLRHAVSKIDLVLCDTLGNDGQLAILKFVRWEQSLFPPSLPVIGISDQWTAAELADARDAGATAMLRTPFTKHALEMAISSAMSGKKAFVMSPTFRGTDRRRAVISGYKGPLRRADDEPRQRTGAARPPSPRRPADGTTTMATPRTGDCAAPTTAKREPRFEWTTTIETGRKDIDLEHMKIFRFMDVLVNTVKTECTTNEIRRAYKNIRSHTHDHFLHEEYIMGQFDYGGREQHKTHHKSFNDKSECLFNELVKLPSCDHDIFKFFHDWWIRHITGIDRKMVDELNTGHDSVFRNDAHAHQMEIIINNAYVIMIGLRKLSTALRGESACSSRSKISRQIGEETERLINLMALADFRIQAHGCTDAQLRRLGEIRAASTLNAESLAEATARRLIDYGTTIISGTYGFPLGASAAVALQMAGIVTLVNVIGGADVVNASLKDAIFRATAVADKIRAMESASLMGLRNIEERLR